MMAEKDIVINNESILSNMPPCPGIKLPESFTPASLLYADSMKSPKVARKGIIIAINK